MLNGITHARSMYLPICHAKLSVSMKKQLQSDGMDGNAAIRYMLLPLLRRSPIQLGHGAHLGPSAQTSVCPGESGFGPSSGVRELAPACASRASRGWVPCLRGKREQSSACMNNKHNTLLWRNLSSVRIPSLPLNPISDPLFSPVANILVSDSFVPRHLPLAQVDQRRRASFRSRRPRLSPVSSSCTGDHPIPRRLG
jgi:hypothetical protein